MSVIYFAFYLFCLGGSLIYEKATEYFDKQAAQTENFFEQKKILAKAREAERINRIFTIVAIISGVGIIVVHAGAFIMQFSPFILIIGIVMLILFMGFSDE